MFSPLDTSGGGYDESESRSLFSTPVRSSSSSDAQSLLKKHRYGAVAPADIQWLTSPEKCITHKLAPTDTLQGIAVKYSVPIELVKNVNKLWNQDFLFLRDSLLIPVPNTPHVKSNGCPGTSPHNTSHPIIDTTDTTSTEDQTPTSQTLLKSDDDAQLASLFSKFDEVLKSTRESTTKLRSNSNLDFSPQLANITSEDNTEHGIFGFSMV